MQKNTLAAIIFALSVFMFFVLVLPQYDAIKFHKEEIVLRQGALNERTAEFNRVKELDGQARSRQSDINKIRSFLPEDKRIEEVISSLKDISDGAGLQLVSLTITASAIPNFDGGNYNKVLINVDLIGRYLAFVNFLKLLEQSLRLYDVFEITAAAPATVGGNSNFAVKINAYHLK